MALSTKASKTRVWLLLGVLGFVGAQSAACSAPFHSCQERRNCHKDPQAEAGAAGDESGGASSEGARPTGGASGSGRGGDGEGRAESGAGGTDDGGTVDQGGQAGAA